MSYQTIQLEFRAGVAVLTLNRPESLNALTVEMGREFQAAVSEALGQGARAIILTGAGRAFCAGGDLRDMQRIPQKTGGSKRFLTSHYACFMIAFW
jgi:2-(1,2-epoxy-1,2-dihydrophenyl)acetyl-CoA isomerase